MQNILKKYIISEEINKVWYFKILLSILLSGLILIFKPFNLTFQQAVIVANTILVIIWWSTGIVKKKNSSLNFLVNSILYF